MRRRCGEEAGGGAGNELVDVDFRRYGIVVLVDQERGGAMHEGPQLECNLLRVSAHFVALAVEGDLVDELEQAGVTGPRTCSAFLSDGSWPNIKRNTAVSSTAKAT